MLISNANELNNMLKKVAMEAMNQVREQAILCGIYTRTIL